MGAFCPRRVACMLLILCGMFPSDKKKIINNEKSLSAIKAEVDD